MQSSFTPVDYEFRELLADVRDRKVAGKVFYFSPDNVFDCAEGRIVALDEIPGEGIFITMEPLATIRIDRIITVFGKPGAAYDEYAALGNSCMECSGGYNFDE